LPGFSPAAGVVVGFGFGVGVSFTTQGDAVGAVCGSPVLVAEHEPFELAVHALPPPDPQEAPWPFEPLALQEFPWVPVLHEPPLEPLVEHAFPLVLHEPP
jgi:hypothetical protein